MPKLYEYQGYVVYFYSNDHRPIHVHVSKQGKEMKVELEDEHFSETNEKGILIACFKKVKKYPVFNGPEKRQIAELIKKYRADIVKKWHLYFTEGRQIKCIKLNKNLNEGLIDKLIRNL